MWREGLVRETFLPFEADKILRIPISISGVNDELCWVLNADGILRVKDVYSHALLSNDFASCSIGPDPIWSKIWKLKVSPQTL